MKLARMFYDGHVRIGGTLNSGARVSLFRLSAGNSMAALLASGPESIREEMRLSTEEALLSEVQLLAPVGDPPKILCIGQNYRDHCEEQNQPFPDRPVLFSKYSTALNRPCGTVFLLPGVSEQVDYEAELAFVIGGSGGGGRNIPVEEAMKHVAGYMCANDVTARDIQFADKQWVRGKTPDGFFPTGPFLVTSDEIEDPHNLKISFKLNDIVMQNSNTSNLIFKIPFLISHFSRTITLQPGDLFSTGTPGGVGVFRNPPLFLKSGDRMEVTIEGIGSLQNIVE